MRTLSTLAVLLVLALVLIFYGDHQQRVDGGGRSEEIVSYDAQGPDYVHKTVSSDDDLDPHCLSEAMIESHPMMWDELARLQPFGTRGDHISSYRGLSESQLLAAIDQQDSAAMTVLGATYEVRARDLPDSKAVPFLNHEEQDLMSYRYSLPLSEAQVENREQAAYWYYQAALHGRLMALTHVGDQLDVLQQSPVDLGWIGQSEYDSLSRAQKSTFNAATVYTTAIYTIAPELEIGLFPETIDSWRRMARRFDIAVPAIVEKYRSDRTALGLPPIVVPESELPPLSELQELLCSTDDDS